MRKILVTMAASIALLWQGGATFAESEQPSLLNQMEGDFHATNFPFHGGRSLPDLKIHYTTFGTPHKNASGAIDNAVLLLHGTTGTGKNFLAPSFVNELYGKGQPLDAEKYFIILPDGIGLGGSSKPSDGLRGKFPHYGYLDMVEAQYRLVTEGLGIKHLELVLGLSMGGMQCWLWGEQHPNFVDALMPIASFPVPVAGRNYLWRRLLVESIRQDPDWKNGDYDTQPTHFVYSLPILNIMVDNPGYLQNLASTREKASKVYESQVENFRKNADANNYLYRYEASADYDPSQTLEKITAKLYAVNFADDEFNPDELQILEHEITRVPHARYVVMPSSPDSRGHLSINQPGRWKSYVSDLLRNPE